MYQAISIFEVRFGKNNRKNGKSLFDISSIAEVLNTIAMLSIVKYSLNDIIMVFIWRL